MLSAIFSTIGVPLISAILDKGLEAFKAYENKQISKEQLIDQLYGLMVNAVKDIEVAYADALTKTYASFMGALAQSKILQRTWAFVTISQAVMLLWFQIGIPMVIAIGLVQRWPSSGSTADWAYLIIVACLGMGPVVLRGGPGASSITDKLKGMIGK